MKTIVMPLLHRGLRQIKPLKHKLLQLTDMSKTLRSVLSNNALVQEAQCSSSMQKTLRKTCMPRCICVE